MNITNFKILIEKQINKTLSSTELLIFLNLQISGNFSVSTASL